MATWTEKDEVPDCNIHLESPLERRELPMWRILTITN